MLQSIDIFALVYTFQDCSNVLSDFFSLDLPALLLKIVGLITVRILWFEKVKTANFTHLNCR